MEKFTTLQAIAAPMPIMNIDTDMIIPKQFLKTIKRTGLGANLFDEMRFDEQGNEIADFILNQAHYRSAGIIIAGENFGCGSSREHAPWALLDFGIKAIIAPSFADIFYNNCFKNGILPLVLPHDACEKLMEAAANKNSSAFTVNLSEQKVTVDGTNLAYEFEIDPFRKQCLEEGLDDIAMTLQKKDAIAAYEEGHQQDYPWLYS